MCAICCDAKEDPDNDPCVCANCQDSLGDIDPDEIRYEPVFADDYALSDVIMAVCGARHPQQF